MVFLSNILQEMFVNRLMDKYGYDDERIREYRQYAANCLVDYDLFVDYNSMLEWLVEHYQRIEIA